jgi:hypothetical protein
MTARKNILTLIVLLLAATPPGWAQGGGNELATELNSLRQQQRQLQDDVIDYRNRIKTLRAARAAGAPRDPELDALEEQLQQALQAQLALVDRETRLVQQLSPGRTSAPAPEVIEADSAEVARLKALLRSHYALMDEEPRPADAQASENQVSLEAARHRVKLSGEEGALLLAEIQRNLGDDTLVSPRRESDLVYHVEVSRAGKLVSSNAFRLKSLGKSQFVGKVSLQGDRATLTLQREEWTTVLDATGSDYLVTLSLMDPNAPELHLIPWSGLAAALPGGLPAWLPSTETATPDPTQS